MKTMRAILIAAALVAGCGGTEYQQPDGSASTCAVVDGKPVARVTAGPDGWCDYDGQTCACHGHGAADQCPEAIAAFGSCSGTGG